MYCSCFLTIIHTPVPSRNRPKTYIVQSNGLEHGETGDNENRPRQDGTDDAPEEHLVLIAGRRVEVVEDQQEDEHVVYAERLLDQIACEELEPGLRPPEIGDAGVERQRQADPDGGPDERLAHVNDVRLPMEHAEVQREHRDDEEKETAPKKNCCSINE